MLIFHISLDGEDKPAIACCQQPPIALGGSSPSKTGGWELR